MFTSRLQMVSTLALFLLIVAPFSYSESEPNDTIANANVMQVNSSETGSLTAAPPHDVYDFYKFTLPSDGMVQIGVKPTTEMNVSIELLDTDAFTSVMSANATGKGGSEGLLHRNLRAGTFFLVVRLEEGTGDYTAMVNFAPAAEVDPEPNDQVSQAAPLQVNGQAEGHLGYYSNQFVDRDDFYRIDLPDDGNLEITSFPDGDLDLALGLYDLPDGSIGLTWVDSKRKGGSETLKYEGLAAGTYHLLVHRNDGFGSYSLTSQFEQTTAAKDAEPNDFFAQAKEIVLETGADDDGTPIATAEVSGRLGFFGNQLQDDRDWYKFQVPFFGDLSFSFEKPDGSSVNPGFDVYDTNGRFIDGTDNDGFTIQDRIPGTYYVSFYRDGGFGAYDFTCKVEQDEAPEPLTEPVSDLAPNGTVSNVFLDENTRSKNFKVTLPQDGQLIVKSRYTSDIEARTALFDANKYNRYGYVDHWRTNDEKVLTFPDLRAGTYIIELYRHNYSGSGSLATEFTPATYSDTEPNDNWTQLDGTAITLNQTTKDLSIKGHIGYGGNNWRDRYDEYVLDVHDDGAISLTGEGEATLEWRMSLHALRGSTIQRLAYTDFWRTTDLRSIDDPNIMAGKYLVRVYRHNYYGSYEVKLNFTPNRTNDSEPNDRPDRAIPITLGQGVAGRLGYDRPFYTDRSDWYRIVLPADGSFQVFAHGDATLEYRLALYNADRTWRIGYSDSWRQTGVRNVGHDGLKAGTYFIEVYRHNYYGNYHLYTAFRQQQKKDTENNNFFSMAIPLQLGEIANGAIGYQTNYSSDWADCYRVDVSAAGRYKLSYQLGGVFESRVEVYAADTLSRIHYTDRWRNTDLHEWESDLDPGTYYIRCYRHGSHFGPYTLRFGSVDGISTGSLSGTVTASNNFPLFGVDVNTLNRDTETDASGVYSYAQLAPGMYRVGFSSGAKYYDVQRDVEIRVGEETVLNVTMLDANKSAPYEVEYFYAIPNDRYVTLFWSPTRSPDVEDGGGYKLYINNEPAIDLGNVLSYRSDEFTNGQTYNFRLAVYDKFGNESGGQTIQTAPRPSDGQPTPTPTPGGPTRTPTPTPTMTPTPGGPTPIPPEGVLGDANANGTLDIGDALAIAQFLGGLRDVLPGADRADINRNSVIDIGDALYIAQVLGGLRSQPNAAKPWVGKDPANITGSSDKQLQTNGDLSVGVRFEDSAYNAGDTVQGRLVIDVGTAALGAYDLQVMYNPSVLQISSVDAGASAEFGSPSVANFDNTAGTLLINDFQATGLDQPTGEVEVAVIDFNVLDVSPGLATVDIQVNSVQDTNFNEVAVTPQSGRVNLGSGGTGAQTVQLNIGEKVYGVGETVSANLTIDAGNSALGAYDLMITYDPSLLSITQVDPGTSTEFGAPSVANFDNNAGQLLVNDFQSQSLTVPTGVVSVAVIQFQVVAATSRSAIIVTSVNSVQDTNFNEIPVTAQSAQVQLSPGGTEPTPTPPPPTALEPSEVFDFSALDQFSEFPGGFDGYAPGAVEIGVMPGPTGDFTDGTGARVTTGPDAVELLLFPAMEVGDDIVLMRLSVQASAAGASIALAVLDGSMDGSIATNIPANSQIFMDSWDRMILVYDPPGTSIIPVVQVANLGNTVPVQVNLDNLEIYRIPRELGALAQLLCGE